MEAANRTHSQSYVEDLLTKSGQKRCAKMARLNLSVLPKLICRGRRGV
ncbi:secretion protein HlyD [Selenomonas massiliensis]|nr:secretion protein HlyD [Selenomonas massiliensis]